MRTDRRPVRLLHTSDVHLAPRQRSEPGEHLEHCLCVLAALHAAAHEHAVDAVLVAGDLFDHGRIPEEFVAAALGTLGRFPVDTVVLVGNHDVHDAASVWLRYRDVVESSGVHLLLDHDGVHLDLLGGALRIWGKAMDEHRPEYRPLHGALPHPGDRWYVVMGHGLHGDERATMGRSSVIRPADISATGADYVALGHVHMTREVSTPEVTAWYPGSPSDAHQPHALLVELGVAERTSVRPVPVGHPAHGCAHLLADA